MILLCVDDKSYAAALAGFDIAVKRAEVLGAPALADEFRLALADFERAHLHALAHQADVTVPALLRRQGE